MIGVATLPSLGVESDGAPLPGALLAALTDVRIQQRLSLPTQCELTFAAPLDTLPAALAPGQTLRLRTEAAEALLFDGEITALEYSYGTAAGAAIRVRGYDLLHRLRKRQSVRVYVQVTARDLAQQLTADFGLEVHADEPGPVWQHLIQHHQSDFELLVDTAQACGLYLAVRDDGLHLLTLDGDGDPVALELGENLLEARIEVNGDSACRSVTATGWDPLRVETHAGTASQARVGRRVAASVEPGQVGGTGERALLDRAAEDDRHAEGVAQAELDLGVAR
ncbi:MAG: type IV secretion protein Rhs, partial [Chloroflexi bacterium]|nr:type IV secretion protein Rhs [Chloroflexota bacterium]